MAQPSRVAQHLPSFVAPVGCSLPLIARHVVPSYLPLCVGYGDYTPVTNEERSFAMFLMLSGGVFFG